MPLSDPLLLERLLLIVGASFAACLVVVLRKTGMASTRWTTT